MIAGWRTSYDIWTGSPSAFRRTIRCPASEFAHGPSEDAGMDLCSAEEVILMPGRWASVGTGLSIELPPGIRRAGAGRAADWPVNTVSTLLNTPGTIDPGYRGEIRVLMINHGDRGYTIWPGRPHRPARRGQLCRGGVGSSRATGRFPARGWRVWLDGGVVAEWQPLRRGCAEIAGWLPLIRKACRPKRCL